MISVNALRSSGALPLLLAGGATLAVLAFHPHLSPHPAEGMLHLLADARLRTQAAYVHGGLIAMLAVLLYGMLKLAGVLNVRRTPVAFGLIAWSFGAAAMSVAMLLDGFATAQLAGALLQKIGAGERPQDILQTAPVVFSLVSVVIQVFTKAGFCAMGVGMCALSWAGREQARCLGWLGLVVGGLPAFAYVLSGVGLGQHQLMVLVACQGIWYAGAAMSMAKLRSGASALS
jgi:hypothetical protein